MKAVSIGDYRDLARRRLPHFLFEYVDGGSYDEVTLQRNLDDLRQVSLRQRVLQDVSELDLAVDLLGQKWNLPVALAPIGLAGMTARRGEVQAARAAAQAGVPFTLSTVSACSLGEVGAAVDAPFWFQLYMIRDRAFMKDLLTQAASVGCATLVFTVDMPTAGARYRDYRSGLAGAPGAIGGLRRLAQAIACPHWAWNVGVRGRPHQLGNVAPILGKNTGLEDFFAWMRGNFDPGISWKDLDFVRANWRGRIVIKGILDTEDALAARSAGVDGIVVSNHGGRQLDGVLSTARALPPIADAVGSDLVVLADGGVRSGLDVARMLALGARGVLIGRAWAFGLAADGQRGVAHVLTLIEAQLRVALTLCGVSKASDLSRSHLAAFPRQ